MIKTIIKISVENKKDVQKLVLTINKAINKSIEYKEYNILYNGNIENGIELNFFESLNNKELLSIHVILQKFYNDYECYYIENDVFAGCIKELLFDKGCNVASYYKTKIKA